MNRAVIASMCRSPTHSTVTLSALLNDSIMIEPCLSEFVPYTNNGFNFSQMTNSKTKVTLPLCLLEHYVMKAYRRVEVYSMHSNPLG
jgi:hypothetical protein